LTGASAESSVSHMTLSFSLCWLATGLWVLADARRAQRAGLFLNRAHVERLRSRLLRGLACALLAGALLPLLQQEGAALGSVAWLLVLMAVLSLAVLMFPLRPRWYLASVALSGLVAVSAWAIG
jgi:cbb3-type cytochrome oxidase subunit 3